MHQQMLARYDTERMTAGLDRVQPHDDYVQKIEVGYDVGKLTIDRFRFVPRPHNIGWKDFAAGELGPLPYTTGDQEARRERF